MNETLRPPTKVMLAEIAIKYYQRTIKEFRETSPQSTEVQVAPLATKYYEGIIEEDCV